MSFGGSRKRLTAVSEAGVVATAWGPSRGDRCPRPPQPWCAQGWLGFGWAGLDRASLARAVVRGWCFLLGEADAASSPAHQ